MVDNLFLLRISSLIERLMRTSSANQVKIPTNKPVKVRISFEKFGKMYNSDKNSVSGAKFIPPKLGTTDLGKFEIELDPSRELEYEF